METGKPAPWDQLKMRATLSMPAVMLLAESSPRTKVPRHCRHAPRNYARAKGCRLRLGTSNAARSPQKERSNCKTPRPAWPLRALQLALIAHMWPHRNAPNKVCQIPEKPSKQGLWCGRGRRRNTATRMGCPPDFEKRSARARRRGRPCGRRRASLKMQRCTRPPACARFNNFA